MMQYFQTQLFIARLQDDLCKELITTYTSFQATYEADQSGSHPEEKQGC